MNEIQTQNSIPRPTSASSSTANVKADLANSAGTRLPPSGEPSPTDAVSKENTDPKVERERLTSLAAELSQYARSIDRNLEFSVDDDSGRTVITVRDSETEEVVRQIPSEEALRLSADLGQSQAVLFDQFA